MGSSQGSPILTPCQLQGQDRGGAETWGLLLWRMLQDAAPSVQAWGSSPALSFLGLGISWFFLQAGSLGASPQKGLVAF